MMYRSSTAVNAGAQLRAPIRRSFSELSQHGASGHGLHVAPVDPQVTRWRRSISGWGSVNPMSGVTLETRHELRGQCFKDKILVFPGAQGSSG
ncbi:MAG TPA: DUF126 domain-containing protein [Steroidobacteraceae bacterium]